MGGRCCVVSAGESWHDVARDLRREFSIPDDIELNLLADLGTGQQFSFSSAAFHDEVRRQSDSKTFGTRDSPCCLHARSTSARRPGGGVSVRARTGVLACA